ncbi:LCP family protein [Paenibacillus algorifonticola]|uniref:LCP family protein n=1 Tax=Paenibacillus algorifonticola TaxID=684063 RepID=UPI003D2C42FC
MEKRPKKAKLSKTWKWILTIVLILLGIGIAYAGYWIYGVYNATSDFNKPKEESRFSHFEDTGLEAPKWEGTERVNILLLGGDARGLDEGQIPRSDSMLVLSIDPTTKKAHLLSILRDTYVPIEGHGRGRINTAITLGKPELAMKTVSDLLGLNIQYYVYTDFEGFKKLIDTLGGITIDVEKDMRYTDNADGNRYDIDLKKGVQLLDGDKALQYVRFRHDAMSDFTRTERQRKFLQALAKEMQSGWNILKMKEILENVSPYIETNLTVTDMLKLGQLGVESHVAGTAQVPPMEMITDEDVGGASVLGVRNEDELKAYVDTLLESDDTLASPEGSPGADGAEASSSPEASATPSP